MHTPVLHKEGDMESLTCRRRGRAPGSSVGKGITQLVRIARSKALRQKSTNCVQGIRGGHAEEGRAVSGASSRWT